MLTPFSITHSAQRAVPPVPPCAARTPVAVRSADLLTGVLVRCGHGTRPVGWPETPRVRASSLSPWVRSGQIVLGLTAAWIWSARRTPGRRIELTTARGRTRVPGEVPICTVREVRLPPEETTMFGGIGVTTPLRTLFDLLHRPQPFELDDVVCCRLLAHQVPGWPEALHGILREHRSAFRARANDRARRIWGDYAPLTR